MRNHLNKLIGFVIASAIVAAVSKFVVSRKAAPSEA